jgi:uncharacterized protein (TIGR03435 family)
MNFLSWYARHFLLFSAGTLVCAQSPSAQRFEVAVVKPAAPFAGKAWIEGGPGTSGPTRIVYHDRSLSQLVYLAYDIKSYQATLPSWMSEVHFDIVANVPTGATKAGLQMMMRNLLEERFRLRTTYESRNVGAYALVVGKSGIRAKAYPKDLPSGILETTPRFRSGEDKDGFIIIPDGYATGVVSTHDGLMRFSFARVPIGYLCNALAAVLLAPVVDETGSSQRFDIHLAFAQETYPAPTPIGDSIEAQASDPAPTLFTAIQKQLGLKLERKTCRWIFSWSSLVKRLQGRTDNPRPARTKQRNRCDRHSLASWNSILHHHALPFNRLRHALALPRIAAVT